MIAVRVFGHQRKTRPNSPVDQDGPARVEQDDYTWVRLVLPLMLYAGVGLLGCFVFWTTGLARSGGAPQVATAEQAELDLRITSTGPELDVARWYPGQGKPSGRGRDITGQGGVAVDGRGDPKRLNVKGESLALPADGSVPLRGAGRSDGSRFFGHRIGGDVASVVFLIDASGSMSDTLPFVIRELTRSLRTLERDTEFSVIFFGGDGRVLEVPPAGLKPATIENTEAAAEWIHPESGMVFAEGQTNPLDALRRALSYEPQVVQLLSDNITGHGRWEVPQAQLLAEVRAMNAHGARIDTVQFLYPDPLIRQSGRGTLRMLSRMTGGRYRFVDGRELGISR